MHISLKKLFFIDMIFNQLHQIKRSEQKVTNFQLLFENRTNLSFNAPWSIITLIDFFILLISLKKNNDASINENVAKV